MSYVLTSLLITHIHRKCGVSTVITVLTMYVVLCVGVCLHKCCNVIILKASHGES